MGLLDIHEHWNNLGLVMDMLNHSSPFITLRYIGITQEQKDSIYLMVEI